MNTIYLFERISELTENYHPEGGAVVIAKSLDDAVKAIKELKASYEWRELKSEITEEEIKSVKILGKTKLEPRLFIFPDAGCC